MNFSDFCKKVLSALGYSVQPDTEDYKFRLLCDDLEEIVIKPMESFGFINCKKEEKILQSSVKSMELDSIQLSDWGREALRTLFDASLYRELKAKQN
jgi:hypothetical protein